MATNHQIFAPAHRAAQMLTLGLGLLCAGRLSLLAQEETALSPEASTATTPPSAEFQYATLTGTSNIVNATLLPVINSSGKTVLENVALHFGFNSSGNLIVTSVQAVPAPPPIYSQFKPGKYCGPGGESMAIVVSGPALTPGGGTEWSLSMAASNSTAYPESASWYVGPLTSNPEYGRISQAKIPSAESSKYSYGIGGTPYINPGDDWYLDSLLGFSQVGNTLTIHSFSYDGGPHHGGTDSNQALDVANYTACK